MTKRRTETWLSLMVIGVGVAVCAIVGVIIWVNATASVHPDPAAVPSVRRAEPAPKWASHSARARELLRTALLEQNLPGLSVAVGVGGDIVWAEGFGWADLAGRVPVTPETRFRIGSASVVLTSAAVGLLLEQQRIRLEDEIQVHVPEFPRKEWPVTVRQVMSHMAGIPSDGGDEAALLSVHCERPVDALKYFGSAQLEFEPGTAYRYSNHGWILMSAAVERAGGQPFAALMQTNVFTPLGMSATLEDSTTKDIPNRATSYFPRAVEATILGQHLLRPVDYSCYAGASAFISTPTDLVRFGGAINSGKLLRPDTLKLLQESQRLPSGEEAGYGLGWDLETVTIGGRSRRVLGHDGDILGGNVSSLVIVPDQDLTVAVLSNISHAQTVALATKVAEVFTP